MKRLIKYCAIGVLAACACAVAEQRHWTTVKADTPFSGFTEGPLILSRSVYQGTSSTVTLGQVLPPLCVAGCTTAIADGTYPGVWANDTVDGSFGVTSPILLDEMTTDGTVLQTLAVDSSQIATSFSSKSELALNLSTDGTALTFMGYIQAGINALDVSNSNTPGVFDPTNPVGTSYYRGVAQLDAPGNMFLTKSNAYSGNNGRASILATPGATPLYYTVGNSNNGTGTPANVVAAGGVQFLTPSRLSVGDQPDPAVEKVGSFSITQVPPNVKADKAGKDDNFRGIAIANSTLFITKGSGSNGIDTVYQVGTAGTLPTAPNTPINVASGFPTAIAKTAGKNNVYPFGLWFANPTTLYVADEGDGVMADASSSPFAGLQKWTFDGTTWHLAYVLQAGLNLGVHYSVAGYPDALHLAPAGLRNLTGRLNGDGTVTIWAITSTVSLSGDQGADPNQLVTIVDSLTASQASDVAGETFSVVRTAVNGEALRGVTFAPRTIPGPTATVTPSPNAAGWNNATTSPVTVNLQATADPSVVEKLQYLLTGAQPSPTTIVNATSANVPIAAEGVTTMSYVEQNLVGSKSFAQTLDIKIDRTAPSVTTSASPSVLWPPNGAMLPVQVSGIISDALSGIDPTSLTFHVIDDDGTVQPSGVVSLNGDGSYSFRVLLQASRRGQDTDGRHYTIIIVARDIAGNMTTSSMVVTVPHDQGR